MRACSRGVLYVYVWRTGEGALEYHEEIFRLEASLTCFATFGHMYKSGSGPCIEGN